MGNSKEIYTEMDPETLKRLITTLPTNYIIVIKFGATWCKPCQNIKSDCESHFSDLPNHVICVDLDVDDNMDIYSFFKNKKMINGIPAIYAYFIKNEFDQNKWYLSDDSVSGSDKTQINTFFNRIKSYININKIAC